jgi:hypothetical protein
MVNKLPTSIHGENNDTPKSTKKKNTVTKDMRVTFNKLPHPLFVHLILQSFHRESEEATLLCKDKFKMKQISILTGQ